MAISAEPIAGPGLGRAAGILVLLFCLGPMAALVSFGGDARMVAADWAVLRFTVLQAGLSAVVSCLLAIPVARAIVRRRFFGRNLLITLLGAPFLLPVIVAVLGLLAIFGRAGLMNEALVWLGLPTLSIYGLQGVVLAHVFFNLPLAVRLLLLGWQSIPAERFRLAASLNQPIGPIIERPMLRRVLPGAALVIFLICLSSFAVALILGGGPRATTLELAIYQSIRFEFALEKAVFLALLQLGFGLIATLLLWSTTLPEAFGKGLDRVSVVWPEGSGFADVFWISLATVFLLMPIAAVFARGLPMLVELPDAVWPALFRSLTVALLSMMLCLILALPLAFTSPSWQALASALPLSVSAIVLGTGVFVVLLPVGNPTRWALAVTAVFNSLASLPFVLRALSQEAKALSENFGALTRALDLKGVSVLRWVILPRLWRPLGFSAGLSAALSMGDLGVIALFATQNHETLPLLMARLMGAYRMEEAAAVAVVLCTTSLLLFWAFDKGGRILAQT